MVLAILGQNFCTALAAYGADLAIIDINEEALQTLTDSITNQYDVKARAYVTDITNAQHIKDTVNQIEDELGPIDILHNNAAYKGKNLKSFFCALRTFF